MRGSRKGLVPPNSHVLTLSFAPGEELMPQIGREASQGRRIKHWGGSRAERRCVLRRNASCEVDDGLNSFRLLNASGVVTARYTAISN